MRANTLRRLPWLLVLVLGLLASCTSESAPDGAVHVLTADTDVGPVMAQYIDRGINRAEDNNARLVVIQLDTPGGLDTSMRSIVQRMERSTVPIVVWVAPAGARAASAGTFITMAANIAAMAPNTSIGAAAAVNSDGSDIGGTLGTKIENDAAAYIRGIAELRGRNADWAEQAVRQAVAVDQTTAVQLHVVDFVANDLSSVLSQSEGRTVEVSPGREVTLTQLTTAPVVETNMTTWERFLDFLSNPTLASLLISLGFIGILIELSHPGLILPGVVGVIALALGFLGFDMLPVDTVGLVLIGFALLLFALELFLPSHGILGIGAAISLILGAIIAFRDTPSNEQPALWILVVLGLFIMCMFLTLAFLVAKVRRMAAFTGTQALIGKIAVARTPLTPEGLVFIQGERWQAQLEAGSAQEGDRVRITGAQGLHLRVKKEDDDDRTPAPAG